MFKTKGFTKIAAPVFNILTDITKHTFSMNKNSYCLCSKSFTYNLIYYHIIIILHSLSLQPDNYLCSIQQTEQTTCACAFYGKGLSSLFFIKIFKYIKQLLIIVKNISI